ncbi:hypothetical protein P3W85_00550 [Cupriavidus basilensis]|uniref:Uncharacterized protein n=1 Tax=Cupriavidus basilensis TaxID=68895 RepID=A0ABT6AFS7_9BURK|nr:hypothetical protein [Cupriavidus basilensis]MDF3831458.1 hypothetical protein [Cupriavidus basilensis]
MSLEKTRPRSRRASVDTEEEKAWVGFYRRVRSDASIAAEVLSQLDADPEMKRQHLALYLCCKESLREAKARQARNKRVGQFVRSMFSALFIQFPRLTRRRFERGAELAAECLPEAMPEPAQAQTRRLAPKREFAAKRTAFDQQQAEPQADALATSPAPSSRATA